MSVKLMEAIQANSLQDVEGLLRLGEDINIRGQDGRNVLQSAINENVSTEILKVLLDRVDLTTRDAKGQSIADIIFTGNYSTDFQGAFVTFVKGEILNGQPARLEKMLLSGWSFWPVTLNQAKNVSPELEEFMTKLPELQEKVKTLHKAIEDDNAREVKVILDRTKLILAADRSGLAPFHKAALYGSKEVLECLLTDFKYALEHKDNMGRTALHYAAAIPDAGCIYSMLVEAGAKEDIKDLTGQTPKDYYSDALQLNIMSIRENITELLVSPIPEPKISSAGGGIQSVYISGQKSSRVPPPTTIDGKYVAEHLGTALTLALAEIAELRPWDPIEYLGHWLHKYRDTMSYIDQQQKLLSSLQSEVLESQKEAEAKKLILEEQKAIQEAERIQREKEEEERKKKEQEELQRKAREADLLAQRPNLDTVTEEGEDDVTGKDKDGQTELHKLAGQEGTDLTALLNLGYNLAERDVNFKTARDIAAEKGLQENVDAIDNFLKSLIEKEKFENLEQLLLDGYDQLQQAIDKLSSEGQSEEVKNFIESVPKTQEKCKHLASLIEKGDTEELKEALSSSGGALMRDSQSRGLLHLAVLHQKRDIVEHLVTEYPQTLKCKDTLNRMPLHYAMGLTNEDITALLVSKGADENAKDVKQKVPSYYKENPTEIQQIKESDISTTTSTQENQVQESEGQGQEGTEQTQDQTENNEGQNLNSQGEGQISQSEDGLVTSGGEQSLEQTPS